MKPLVILPTYNEADNIRVITELLLKAAPQCEILIIDDNSTDGTAEKAQRLAGERKGKIHLIKRPGKLGYGTAYKEGFRFALNGGYDAIFQMDADLSHDPAEIPNFLARLPDTDIVLGSRYIGGIRIINWPIYRLLMSYCAGVYCRLMTGMKVADPTSGFKCFSRKALERIPFNDIKADGYAFQIEVNFTALRLGLRITEIPIIFTERRDGQSKMSAAIMIEAVLLGLRLLFKRFF